MTILRPPRWSHTFLRLCADCPAAAQAKLRGEPSVAPQNVRSGLRDCCAGGFATGVNIQSQVTDLKTSRFFAV